VRTRANDDNMHAVHVDDPSVVVERMFDCAVDARRVPAFCSGTKPSSTFQDMGSSPPGRVEPRRSNGLCEDDNSGLVLGLGQKERRQAGSLLGRSR
jgi:hypothetical protein